MKIAIYDCEVEYARRLSESVNKYIQKNAVDAQVDIFNSPQEVPISGDFYTIAFLSLRRGDKRGLSIASDLKKQNDNILLFFISDDYEYHDAAMDLDTFRFYDRSFNEERLFSGLEKAFARINRIYTFVYIVTDGKHNKLSAADIAYIERDGRKVYISSGGQKYRIKRTFDEICKLLPQSFFYRVHYSFFINLNFVTQYGYTEIILTDGTTIPVAQRKQAAFHRYWENFIRQSQK